MFFKNKPAAPPEHVHKCDGDFLASQNETIEGCNKTHIIWQCRECLKWSVITLNGSWTNDELKLIK